MREGGEPGAAGVDAERAAQGSPVARPDFGRESRKGVPEIVLAESKSDDQVVAIVRAFLDRTGRAVVTRMRPATMSRLAAEFEGARIDLREVARAAAFYAPAYERARTGGRVGILSAGTGDVPVAEEARLIAEEMGCDVTTAYDVGVAGIHRLFGPLEALLAADVGALIVAAGMDGALPSVVAGLAPVPVIGLPTSIGYGAGGRGRAALLSMLQSCAPGLTVVNIDNGVGAGAAAVLIAARAGESRRRRPARATRRSAGAAGEPRARSRSG